MKKRVLAGLLWFYAAWYAWGFVADATGVSMLVGPVLGFIAAALVAGDPFGRFWGTDKARRTRPDLSSAVGEPA